MALKPWMKGGKVLVNNGGQVILCDNCPCDIPPIIGTGSGTSSIGTGSATGCVWCHDPPTITATFGGGTGWAVQLNGISITLSIFTDPTSGCSLWDGILGVGCGVDDTLWNMNILTGPTNGKLSAIKITVYPNYPGHTPMTLEIVTRSDGLKPGFNGTTCGGPCFPTNSIHDLTVVNTPTPVSGTISGVCDPINFVTGDITISVFGTVTVPGTSITCVTTTGTIKVALSP